MRKKVIVALIAFIALTERSNAQRYISIVKAVETAQSNNSNVKMSYWDEKISNAEYRQTDASFLPQVSLEYSALGTNNPLNAFGLLLNQSIVSANDLNPSKLNDPGFSHNFNTKVEVRQPIFNLDMIYARKGAKAKEEAYKYGTIRTLQQIALEVRKAYCQLQFSYQAKNLLRQSLKEVKIISQSVENFRKQGLLQKSDLLNSQVQVNTVEATLAKAETNIQNASEDLALLMGTDNPNEIIITDTLSSSTFMPPNNELSMSRADIQMLNKSIESIELTTKSVHMQIMPRMNAFGSYQLNDSHVLGFKADSYLVGVTLSWNIFSGNSNKNKYKSYLFKKEKMIEEKNLYIRQSQLEINKTIRDIHDISIEIEKDKMSVAQADEALRILQNRFKVGLANTTDLLSAQSQLSGQRILLLEAIMNYQITSYYLDYLLEK